MKELKNISLYKVLIVFFISIYFKSYLLLILLYLYLYLDHKYNVIYLIILFLLCLLFSYIRFDFIKYGIVESNNKSYYLIDSFLYKRILYSEIEYEVGDFLYIEDSKKIENISHLKKNILYTSNDAKKLSIFYPRKLFHKFIDNSEDEIKNLYYKIFYDEIIEYDNFSSLLFNSIIYYFLLNIYHNNKNRCLIVMSIIIIFINFQIKFLFIILNYILDKYKFKRLEKALIKGLIIYYINPNLMFNYSIIFHLFISILYSLDLKYEIYIYLSIFQSIIFGSINILYTFLFSFINKFKSKLLLISLFTLLFKPSQIIMIKSLNY